MNNKQNAAVYLKSVGGYGAKGTLCIYMLFFLVWYIKELYYHIIYVSVRKIHAAGFFLI